MSVTGCSVALGPGYTIEKQRVEVSYRLEAPDRVAVRASYQLNNSGTAPLEKIAMDLPRAEEYASRDFVVEWRGVPKTLPVTGIVDEDYQFPLTTRWDHGERGEFIVSYELKISPGPGAAAP